MYLSLASLCWPSIYAFGLFSVFFIILPSALMYFRFSSYRRNAYIFNFLGFPFLFLTFLMVWLVWAAGTALFFITPNLWISLVCNIVVLIQSTSLLATGLFLFGFIPIFFAKATFYSSIHDSFLGGFLSCWVYAFEIFPCCSKYGVFAALLLTYVLT